MPEIVIPTPHRAARSRPDHFISPRQFLLNDTLAAGRAQPAARATA